MSGRWGIGRQLTVWVCGCAVIVVVLWVLHRTGVPPLVSGDGWSRVRTPSDADFSNIVGWIALFGILGGIGIASRTDLPLQLATWSLFWFAIASLVAFASGSERSNGIEAEHDPGAVIVLIVGLVWLLGIVLMPISAFADHRRRRPLVRANASVCPTCGANDLGRRGECPVCGGSVDGRHANGPVGG